MLYIRMPMMRILSSMKIASIAISLILIISVQTLQKSDAQQQDPRQTTQQPPKPLNFTSSIALAPTLLEALKSKINVSLIDAVTNITNHLGPNSTVFSASMQPVRGYLVYQIEVLDDSNKIKMLLVDPVNGSILAQQQSTAGIN